LEASRPNQFTMATIDARLAMEDPVATLSAIDPGPVAAAVASLAAKAGVVLEPFDRFRD
jgi:hypothetical protein